MVEENKVCELKVPVPVFRPDEILFFKGTKLDFVKDENDKEVLITNELNPR